MKNIGLLSNQKQTKCFNLKNWASGDAEGKKFKQQKLGSFCSKKGLFKPAQILKIECLLFKTISQVKIMQQTDEEGLNSVQKK